MSGIPIERDCCETPPRSPRHTSQQEIARGGECSAMECEGDREDVIEKPPLYFPQADNEYASKPDCSMGSVGPWVTGEPTRSPKGGITGLQPVADRYSITRYGPSEWRAHNLSLFRQSDEKIGDTQVMASDVKRYVEQTYRTADEVQSSTTESLKDRAGATYRWEIELRDAISAIIEEMGSLEAERRRVKRSLAALIVAASAAGEFLQLRSSRLESDLVRDETEEELTKEIALCATVRDQLSRNCKQIEAQVIGLKAAKARIENDWSDKAHAYDVDSACVNLSNDSPLLLCKPGVTRFPADQSTPAGRDHFTREALSAGEAVRQGSISLRTTLKRIHDNFVKELRDQAQRVDIALVMNIQLTQECLQQLEIELGRCLRELASTEKLIGELRDSTKGLANSLKLAQTRLDKRLHRRDIENCRDTAQFALVEEARLLGERTTGMLAKLRHAEESQAELVKIRGNLEHEIIVKRKTLYIDKERGQLLHAFFPSATDLSGF